MVMFSKIVLFSTSILAGLVAADGTIGHDRLTREIVPAWQVKSARAAPPALCKAPSTCSWDVNHADDPNNIPHTGVTRQYFFNVSRAVLAPDGVDRPMIITNGQFPGPTIEANWGDTIEVTVLNNIFDEEEGLSIHWHGIRQIGTPYYDGVPSTSQCPIVPGGQFTYKFTADAYGSAFWHSHVSAQYSAGIFGGIVIYGPEQPKYDVDVGPVFLSDWYHLPYLDIVESIVGLPAPLTQAYSDNNLINGRMPFDCTNANITAFNLTCTSDAPYSNFTLARGKSHRLRLMNVGSQATQRFHIDGLKLKVIANDFIPIVPYETDVLTIGIGQRADVLVTPPEDFPLDPVWMRSDVSATCCVSTQGYAKAAVYIDGHNTSLLPNTTAISYDDSNCGNEPLNLTTPLYPMSPPETPTVVQQLDIEFYKNSSGNLLWFVNGETFRADYDKPILLLSKAGNNSYPNPDWTVYNVSTQSKQSSVRLVLYNYAETIHSQHPMHLHGHNFWIVAQGLGKWDGVANTNNPMRRDTFIMQPGYEAVGPSYLVIDFVTDNPGTHLAWHVSAGLYVNILERSDKIAQMKIPREIYHTCRDWTRYKGTDLAVEIDSGV